MAEDFLLEIGCDEIPARYLPLAISDLREKAQAALESARLPFARLETFGTPRRLALLVYGLSEASRDAVTKVRGPSKKVAFDADGNPTRALVGFSKSLGIDPSQVTLERENGGEYVYGEKRVKGRPAPVVLAEALPPAVMGLESPYPLRWGDQDWRWYRPIRWVVALFGREVVPLSVAGVDSGRLTWGHRTLHPGSLEILSAGEYFAVMKRAGVVVDPEERKRGIVRGAMRLAAELGGKPLIDDDLLSEVSSLCERPAPFLGRFKQGYGRLPKEVLITAMRHHQRYFPIEDSDGTVLPGFVGVRDGSAKRGIETVRSGNEWVLAARLRDAGFFYEQDRRVLLEDRLPELQGIRFLRNSGTMLDKARRAERLAQHVAVALGLPESGRKAAAAAARLAKADLTTAMVREFPELEGIIGGRYGEEEGLPAAITAAIRDQYLPRGGKDRLPEKGVASAVALVDKLDTLAVSFALGLEVSGSADPFGLRRSALGIAAILMGHGYDADLAHLVKMPVELAAEVVPNPALDAGARLLRFILDRVEGVLLEMGYGVEVVRAVLGGGEKRIARLPQMAEALQALSGSAALADVVTGWRRTSVLAKEAAGQDVVVEPGFLKEDPEVALYRAFKEREKRAALLYEGRCYPRYLALLRDMRPYIDRCLDEVLIMAEDPSVRANRLALLKAVSLLFTRFAGFSHVLPLVPREG